MSFSGSRAGHYTPLSTDGNESSLLSRDERVRRARVVREGPRAATSACNNEISREQEPIDARNLTRRLTSRLRRIERLRVCLIAIAG
jgi:hypothetical protein